MTKKKPAKKAAKLLRGTERKNETAKLAKKVADRLREFRNQSKLTQVEAAKKIGVSQGELSAYESGHRRIMLLALVRASEAYGASLDAFVK